MTMRSTILAATALLATTALPASAIVTRTWVSNTGADSGTCQLVSPCKTFQYAYGQTSPGGEINVLDSGSYGSLHVNMSISIIAEGAVASVGVPSGNSGIFIDAPNDVIVLHGLNIDGHNSGGNSGINGYRAQTVIIDHCIVENSTNGIVVQNGNFIVEHNVVTGNSTGLQNLHATANLYLRDNTIAGNDVGVGGPAYSYGDNTINGNAVDVSGTLLGVSQR